MDNELYGSASFAQMRAFEPLDDLLNKLAQRDHGEEYWCYFYKGYLRCVFCSEVICSTPHVVFQPAIAEHGTKHLKELNLLPFI